jgi:pimeloyl-ACP methyl ester carboxylesterase
MVLNGFICGMVAAMPAAAPSADPAVPIRLNTFAWGRASGPSVLLVHGVQSSAGTWWQIADGLARRGLGVTAPDLRGHGLSPSGQSYRLIDFVEDLAALAGNWDVVVGHSLGGTVIAHALVDGHWPACHAVLLDPVLELPEAEFDAIVQGQLAELATVDAAALQRANPRWHPEDCRQKALAAACCSPFVNEAVLRDNRPWDYGDLLARTASPVLVLGADEGAGGMLDPGLGRRIAASNSHVSYRRIAGAGQSLHRDRPQLVVDAVLDLV